MQVAKSKSEKFPSLECDPVAHRAEGDPRTPACLPRKTSVNFVWKRLAHGGCQTAVVPGGWKIFVVEEEDRVRRTRALAASDKKQIVVVQD